MAPEIEVSEDQLEAIRDWIGWKGGRCIAKWSHDCVGVWIVDNKQIVVQRTPIVQDWDGNFNLSLPPKNILICSDKHAKELEEAGIVSFSEAEVAES